MLSFPYSKQEQRWDVKLEPFATLSFTLRAAVAAAKLRGVSS